MNARSLIEVWIEAVRKPLLRELLEAITFSSSGDLWTVVAINLLGERWPLDAETDRYQAEVIQRRALRLLEADELDRFAELYGVPEAFIVPLDH